MSTVKMSEQFGDDLEDAVDGTKKILPCVKINRHQLNTGEKIEIRIFYWASFFGLKKSVRFMILKLR